MLDVYLSKHLIGQLSCSRSGWAFEHDARWQASSQGFDLSPHLPRNTGMITGTVKAQPIHHFSEYPLPEAARSTPRAAAVALECLAQVTPHLDGPLALVPNGLRPCSDRADGLSKRDLVLQFQQTVKRPPHDAPLCAVEPRAHYGTDTAEATGEISLPFLASNGLPVSIWLGRFSAPTNAAQSSRFVRLDFSEGAHPPYATIDHYWATLLSRNIGLDTPFIGLRQFPETAAIMQRLDRTLRRKSDDTALVQVRYVVSATQLLGLSSKYRFLPITVGQAVQCTSLCTNPAPTTAALFRRMVFCLLIGGRNTSASTLHFHTGTDGVRLTAHDHLSCTAVYANERNADELSPDVQTHYGAIDQDALLALANHLGCDASQAHREPLRLVSMLAPQSPFVATHLSQALGHLPTRAAEIDFLMRIRRHVSETTRRLGRKTAEI